MSEHLEQLVLAQDETIEGMKKLLGQCVRRINFLLTERELTMKTQADLQTSITGLETEVAALKAVPPVVVAPDLTAEVARVDAVTADIKAMTQTHAPVVPAPPPAV